MYPGFVDTLYY